MKIYNSLTRKKEDFKPIEEGRVGMYVCGPTVYDSPHIGHARSAYIFDVIRRYLEYKTYHVNFVRNVTDVDDKIINKAREGKETDLVEAVKTVSKTYLDAYHRDMALLAIGVPNEEPKATEYIPKMIDFIALLIKNERAYEAGGDVYFDIKKASSYGKLSNQSIDKMEVGSRIAPGEKKRDGLDFALWKAAKEGEPSWESPWGKGRPGWHIECSVMSSDILGDEFDIHGGGIDLVFPHHENEIAQSEGTGKKFARFWIHNGLLTINGEKMAKSLGNFISIKDFMDKHKDPDYLKLFFLSAHYRSPIDYTEEKIKEAKKEKERFWILLGKINKISGVREENVEAAEFRKKFEEAMDDDFNTPLALASLFDLVTYANKFIHERSAFQDEEKEKISGLRDLLLELSRVFGLALSEEIHDKAIVPGEIAKLIDERNEARKEKNFKKADDIRKRLFEKGILVEDTKKGTTWRRRS